MLRENKSTMKPTRECSEAEAVKGRKHKGFARRNHDDIKGRAKTRHRKGARPRENTSREAKNKGEPLSGRAGRWQLWNKRTTTTCARRKMMKNGRKDVKNG